MLQSRPLLNANPAPSAPSHHGVTSAAALRPFLCRWQAISGRGLGRVRGPIGCNGHGEFARPRNTPSNRQAGGPALADGLAGRVQPHYCVRDHNRHDAASSDDAARQSRRCWTGRNRPFRGVRRDRQGLARGPGCFSRRARQTGTVTAYVRITRIAEFRPAPLACRKGLQQYSVAGWSSFERCCRGTGV